MCCVFLVMQKMEGKELMTKTKAAFWSIKWFGNQTIVSAKTEIEAAEWALRKFGRCNAPYSVKAATKSDVSWVEAMGGCIHSC